jgi:O-acetyl-ADP-ribose deacetylase (regulator of RNase III)
MVKEVIGDILLTGSNTIAHCVAPMDHFDTGLALNLREHYPSMVKDFRHYCHTHHPKPGEIWSWAGVGGKRIVNLMAQEPAPSERYKGHPGKATIGHLDLCLKNLQKYLKAESIESVALPRLATGVGGLDWEEVRRSVFKHFDTTDIKVFLYSTFVKNQKASE